MVSEPGINVKRLAASAGLHIFQLGLCSIVKQQLFIERLFCQAVFSKPRSIGADTRHRESFLQKTQDDFLKFTAIRKRAYQIKPAFARVHRRTSRAEA